jgi:hypothetical protein
MNYSTAAEFCLLSLEEGLQEPLDLIVRSHHVEVEDAIAFKGENQSNGPAQAALIDLITAALSRQVANTNS